MEAAGGQDPSPTTDVAPITAVVAAQVKRLRTEARLSGPKLAERLADYGVRWTRTTVAKFETGLRSSITVQELLALALVLDVPPMMLLADPRHVDVVPVAKDLTVAAWDALLWMSGTGTITESDLRTITGSDLNNYSSAAWLIQAGWTIVENVAELRRHDMVFDSSDPDQVQRAQERDDGRHRAALGRIRAAMIRIAGKAPLPPMLPLDFVYRRAAELDVDMPNLDG